MCWPPPGACHAPSPCRSTHCPPAWSHSSTGCGAAESYVRHRQFGNSGEQHGRAIELVQAVAWSHSSTGCAGQRHACTTSVVFHAAMIQQTKNDSDIRHSKATEPVQAAAWSQSSRGCRPPETHTQHRQFGNNGKQHGRAIELVQATAWSHSSTGCGAAETHTCDTDGWPCLGNTDSSAAQEHMFRRAAWLHSSTGCRVRPHVQHR
jgi:hypothetical protein